MKVGKTRIALKGVFILIVGLIVNLLFGLLIAYSQYLSFYKIEGLKLAWDEFLSQPLLVFKVLVLNQTAGNEVWMKIHEIYFDMRFQLVFLAFYAYWIFHFLSKSKKLKRQDASEYGSHGSARWASKKEVKKALFKDRNGFILGEMKGEIAVHPKETKLNQIITTFGGSGSGKSAGYSITNVLYNAEEVGESLVITDPKGELYNTTSRHLEKHGYDILIFNLLDMKRSMRYNPMNFVSTTEEALGLANMIISNTDGRNPSGDSMWRNAEMAYYAALMMYIKEMRPKEDHHIKSVLQFGTRIGQDEDLLDEIFSQLPEDSEALEMYNIFKLAQDRTRSGILIGFGVRLKLWVSKNIAQLTRTSDFDLNQLGKKKTALFLLIPDSDSTYDLIPALLIDQLFQELYKQAGKNDNLKLQVNVRCILDELANIAAINDFERKVSTMRSRGISVVPIFQSMTQFKNRYDNNRWSEIIASSDTICFLGTNDKDTAEYFSEKIGKTTLLIQNYSMSENSRGASESQGHTFVGRPLITPDELEKMPDDKVIIMQKGRNPAMIDKHFYYKQKKWANLELVNWSKDIPERQDPPLKVFNPLKDPEPLEEMAATSEEDIPDFLTEDKDDTNNSHVATSSEELITKNEVDAERQQPPEEEIITESPDEDTMVDEPISIEHEPIDIESEISQNIEYDESINEMEISNDDIPEDTPDEPAHEEEKQEPSQKGYLDSLFDDEEKKKKDDGDGFLD